MTAKVEAEAKADADGSMAVWILIYKHKRIYHLSACQYLSISICHYLSISVSQYFNISVSQCVYLSNLSDGATNPCQNWLAVHHPTAELKKSMELVEGQKIRVSCC